MFTYSSAVGLGDEDAVVRVEGHTLCVSVVWSKSLNLGDQVLVEEDLANVGCNSGWDRVVGQGNIGIMSQDFWILY